MKLALVQTDPIFGDVQRNVAQALQWMKRDKADLYVLPELFNTGYNFVAQKEVDDLGEPAGRGFTYSALAAFAKENKTHIVYGFAEKQRRSAYNACSLVGPRGLIDTYRKTHLFGRETLFFKPGNTGFRVHRLPFGRLGMMICFDWYFPEATRTLALMGAQLIAHPSNLVLPNCPEGMKTRCLENRVFAATADRVGAETRGGRTLHYIGQSQLVSPLGKVMVRMGSSKGGIRFVNLDLKEANRKRVGDYNDLLKDRRPTFYRAL